MKTATSATQCSVHKVPRGLQGGVSSSTPEPRPYRTPTCFSMPATPSKHVRVSFRNVDDVSRLSEPACVFASTRSAAGSAASPLIPHRRSARQL